VEISYTGLLIVIGVAVCAPLIANLARRLHLPSPALEIVFGIVVGPQVLDWVAADDLVVEVVSSLGVAFLLFLAGLELDLPSLNSRRRPILKSYGITLLLAFPVAYGIHLLDASDETTFLAIALVATSLGLVVPILQDSGQMETSFGQTVMGNASMAEFASILFLSLFFSQDGTKPSSELFLLVVFGVLVLVIGAALLRAGHWVAVSRTVLRLENTSAQLSIRVAMVLLLVFVAFSGEIGVETVLGAFVAGALIRVVDPEARLTHEVFMGKVQAIGYGFLVPAFFVATGIGFDVDALLDSGNSAVLVPAFLVGLLIVRGLPALVYRGEMGLRRSMAAGLLQATSLSFLIVAAQVGKEIETIDAATSAAVVGGGLLSVILFPPVALGLLGRQPGKDMPKNWRRPGLLEKAAEAAESSDEASLVGSGVVPATAGRPALGIDATDLRVVTWNLRFFNVLDGDDAWPERSDEVLELVRSLSPDVLGFQEALGQQLEDVVEGLPDHDWYGQGRSDGELGGEMTPIFYRRKRFDPVDGGTFWLSEDPDDAGSRSWGASHPRIATWLVLHDRWTDVRLVVANTHLDHAKSEIRVHQAEVLLERLLPIVADRPLVLVGDLNDKPASKVHSVFAEVLRDARAVSATPPEGPSTTFNGFKGPKDGFLIDHVFVRGALEVQALRVVDDQGEGGRFLSDHYPVLTSLRLDT
jgi:Kef-type K+ transport system membrane component KefB/endonuclease/exonuclease/phosphatase family metal-dependent hydrolase